MSGHSKWAKIKRAKAANDAKKGAIFTKLARNITVAVQEGGEDPDMNFTLRLAIDKAKEANMPSDNIKRAIKRGTGELIEGRIEKITYEAIIGKNVGILIDCSTDNTNRTYNEVKTIVETNGGKMAKTGSISWQFDEFGHIEVGIAKLEKAKKHGEDDYYANTELVDFENYLIEIDGVLDYEIFDPLEDTDDDWEESEKRPKNRKYIFITTEKEQLKKVTDQIAEEKWQVLESDLIKESKNKVKIEDEEKEKVESLITQIEDHDDVDQVWNNISEQKK